MMRLIADKQATVYLNAVAGEFIHFGQERLRIDDDTVADDADDAGMKNAGGMSRSTNLAVPYTV